MFLGGEVINGEKEDDDDDGEDEVVQELGRKGHMTFTSQRSALIYHRFYPFFCHGRRSETNIDRRTPCAIDRQRSAQNPARCIPRSIKSNKKKTLLFSYPPLLERTIHKEKRKTSASIDNNISSSTDTSQQTSTDIPNPSTDSCELPPIDTSIKKLIYTRLREMKQAEADLDNTSEPINQLAKVFYEKIDRRSYHNIDRRSIRINKRQLRCMSNSTRSNKEKSLLFSDPTLLEHTIRK
ncbi:hypothetical protein F2Q70_00043126 [Brassica cretica]|uniref:Uncharacterized protein n=1 Tax=Brassica cretica TaxID=69181 RepID=A0A8S9KQ60_BRACR|nr:hypothetical protein F2Q70_00043126 [Brassica cretica]